jgi:CRP-like cAMP-binding protein
VDPKTALQWMRNDLLLGLPKNTALKSLVQYVTSQFEGPLTISKGSELVVHGDASTHVYFLLDGTVAEIGRDDQGGLLIPTAFQAGQWFFNLQRHTTGKTAESPFVCVSNVQVMRLDQTLWEQLQSEPGCDELLFIIQQRILDQVRGHFRRLLHTSPLEHYQWILKESPTLVKDFTRDQMAAYLGVSRATFFRLLQKV